MGTYSNETSDPVFSCLHWLTVLRLRIRQDKTQINQMIENKKYGCTSGCSSLFQTLLHVQVFLFNLAFVLSSEAFLFSRTIKSTVILKGRGCVLPVLEAQHNIWNVKFQKLLKVKICNILFQMH